MTATNKGLAIRISAIAIPVAVLIAAALIQTWSETSANTDSIKRHDREITEIRRAIRDDISDIRESLADLRGYIKGRDR